MPESTILLSVRISKLEINETMNKPSFIKRFLCAVCICSFFSCAENQKSHSQPASISGVPGTFGYDKSFLRHHQPDVIELAHPDGAAILIAPALQGRVMTSTAAGDSGVSFGWINHELIASGQNMPHFHPFGGEERFWLGPEGGKFSVYFRKGTDFIFENWFVPKQLDTEPFQLLSADKDEAVFEKMITLENYTGTIMDAHVSRTIRLLERSAVAASLGASIPEGLQLVAFESDNVLSNRGKNAWTKQNGLLSIWILSMLQASDSTVVAVPYQKGSNGPIVTDTYFGKVPQDRLKTDSSLILFKADAHHRSKIGVGPSRAKPIMASYDPMRNLLTIAQFSMDTNRKDYLNSLWEYREDPFGGDVINAYNDGPVDSVQMGKFYELESSSPAAELKPGASVRHIHRTIHFMGNRDELDKLTQKVLGVPLSKITL